MQSILNMTEHELIHAIEHMFKELFMTYDSVT